MTQSMQSSMAGKMTTQVYDGITIHTYTAPEDSVLVTTQIVETPAGLVIFDSGLFIEYSAEFADYAGSLGRPVERIVLSHIHPDHWSGLGVLHEHFPDAPIYAFREVTSYIETNGQTMLDTRNQVFGGRLAKTPTLPTHDLAEGATEIGGVTFVFEKVREGEAHWGTVVKMPEQHVLMAFDMVAAPNTHMFTAEGGFDAWIAHLEDFKPLREQGYTTILVGHGPATDFDVLDDLISYLRSAIAAHRSSKTPEEYADRVKDAYPSYYGGAWVDFSSLMLYGVINP
ncbi:MBL fold metallo-hydrolase [Streptomyces sp. IBSNAI002]|uniref:MBL fold metallo-hydrolase n=1 Tax=Streptomyces sp. IBSNAI002 TaxID=3457500 RepID=UPI003FD183A6